MTAQDITAGGGTTSPAPDDGTTKTPLVVSEEAANTMLPTDPSSSTPTDQDSAAAVEQGIHILETKSVHWYSYLTTPDFWLVLGIGQVLALCITSTNTFTTLLAEAGTNIPAFQTMFNYILLLLIYTTTFLVKEGPREWGKVAWRHGWKYLIMAFLDVEGNYFTVLAYRYTNILSAQLINFWAIVVVVVVSFLALKVRYRIFQIVGIVVCCGGMGILIGSDHLTGGNGGPGTDLLKGDMFALVGSTCYGLSNVFEEWLVSRAPMYHVLSFIGLFGVVINGVQAAIFDRDAFRSATWDADVAGWIVGFTLCMTLFYSLVPLVLRMASAGFYNISLLTANFWGVIIGVRVFGLRVHFMYPIAFVCIVLGLVTYFLSGSTLGESKKPWLGDNQEGGVAGVGTAKLKALNAARKAREQGEPA
ncbi:putative solute carrier family 35 member-like protein [Hapsidospora chrysogenum ATCC 11550]|uniref:Putative solute carrier family 35 member-like protein n=1 Tax=Hapsidospora chrysogenum (strain ATCC 11550 / CBS 779.69 / DSM 880 / IAM 14645 / JCM 23072 / IMI 49137) TaxID=857340 RepID=A0A086SYF3_HAPC1|nr:putative solute carrier family 35 member-like protein [Hapsidospora chrysogenum ATCC 11550]